MVFPFCITLQMNALLPQLISNLVKCTENTKCKITDFFSRALFLFNVSGSVTLHLVLYK